MRIPGYISTDKVDVWFQDEARFGQKNTTTHVWSPVGARPRAVRQQQFEYAYLFGAVCPARGIGEAIVVPWINKEVMHKQIELIANVTDPDRHAIVVMDGASWHNEELSAEFDNVSMIKLPPYSPELNPIEKVWSWMRQHHLANRTFKGYDDIVSSVCKAWNSFLSSGERVTNMCTRDWINLTS